MLKFRKKKYDEYDDDLDEESSAIGAVKPIPAGKKDFAIAVVLGVAVFFATSLVCSGFMHPTAWADALVASGLRPATEIAPGLWRIFARTMYSSLGIEGGTAALTAAGKISLSVCVAFVYLLFRDILAVLIRTTTNYSIWSSVLSRIISLFAAVAFLCADPVWSLCYAFTPTGLTALLFIVCAFLCMHFIASGTLMPAYWATFLLGVLCAETPLGMFLLAFFTMVFYVLLGKGGLSHVLFLNPLIRHSSKWYMTFFWAFGVVLAIGLNVWSFIACHGPEAMGISAGNIPLKYVICLWNQLSSAASPGGWVLGIGFAVVPFLIAVCMLKRATDIEYFLGYHVGIVYFSVGVLAYTQVASLQPLWFWTLPYEAIKVESQTMLFLFSLLFSITILCALSVVAVDVFCRNNRRLVSQMNEGADGAERGGSYKNLLRVGAFSAGLFILLAGMLPGRSQSRVNVLSEIMRDYVREIVDEAEGLDYLFTDGVFDWEIEKESILRGHKLETISMMPGSRSRNVWSLKSVMKDSEDRLSAEAGSPNLLRTWQRDRPDRLECAGMQLGLEIWRERSGRRYPPVSGAMARVKWPSEESRLKGIENARSLAQRIGEVYKACPNLEKSLGRVYRDKFLCMQWRLSRLARTRAEICDFHGDTDGANRENALADALDANNEALKQMKGQLAKLKEHILRQMSPREGLHFALLRADFKLGKKYAQPILESSPDDLDANFAMGMSYFEDEQFSRAEEHLLKCRDRHPGEPVVRNNLALCQLRLGKLDEAKENADAALKLFPDSPAIFDTVRQVDAAIEASKTGNDGTQEAK